MWELHCSTYHKQGEENPDFNWKTWASVCWLGPSVPPVVAVGVLEHVLTGYFSFEFGADEEGAAHLAVEGVRLLGRRRESLSQHHGDEAVDPLRGALGAEVKRLGGGEGLPEDHHCVHVGVLHRLVTGTQKLVDKCYCWLFHLNTESYLMCLLHVLLRRVKRTTSLKHHVLCQICFFTVALYRPALSTFSGFWFKF